jgi:GTP-binding protein HflX
VYNKVDQLAQPVTKIARDQTDTISAVWLSAQQNQGMALLQQALQERLSQRWVQSTIQLTANQGRLRAQLYQMGSILHEAITSTGDWEIQVRLSPTDDARLRKNPEIQMTERP